MVYDAFRVNGGPTQYTPNYNPVTADVLEVGFILAFCILAFCFIVISPGFRGKNGFFFLVRVIVSLFIGSAILLGVLGQEWESAEIETKTPYKVFTPTEIHAKVGVKIGLGSVNVTLKGVPIEQSLELGPNGTHSVDHIDYNERFHWAWRQGRFGFGPYSGRINQEFRDGQNRGLPIPLLWVAEYFTLDGELIRWGRSFRTAGWFTWQVLWTAFPLWVIANALSVMVLSYCGWMFALTGGFMLVSNIIYSTIRWGTQPLVIPFEDDTLRLHFGPSFWLTMSGGIVSCVYGFIIVLMDHLCPQMISDFFGIDILQDPEEFYHKEDESSEEVELISRAPSGPSGAAARRIKGRGRTGRFSRSARRKPRPQKSNREGAYANTNFESDRDQNYDQIETRPESNEYESVRM